MNQGMPTIEPNVTTLEVETPACAVCPHPWATHDRIAMRFCTATTTENHSRGCVCR
ncbi:RGCVC family protein [Saccharothrix sp. ALI-22-I]|uniref:RGCVC family protein n=1 Tax=Saccharothrix sp. ALI-22-I TaxID=1933778 RepID=UPI0015C3F102|nr:RGCVC family protein [Saccharothrix sp. ALI-22-I]